MSRITHPSNFRQQKSIYHPFSINVYLSSSCFSEHYSNAFSAMRIADYKNFLRMHIKDDELTIYPIGVEKVSGRDSWAENTKHEALNPDEPKVISKTPINYTLIEGPISIKPVKTDDNKLV